MAYYAPIGLMQLVPTWYALILLGYAAMYWAMGVGDWFTVPFKWLVPVYARV